MKPYKLIAPILALPFVAAAQGQEKGEEYKQILVQNFCACASGTTSSNDSETLSIQDYVAEQELKREQDAANSKQEPFSRSITIQLGDPDLTW